MRIGDATYLHVVGGIQEAALDSGLWPAVLAGLSAAFDGLQASLYSHDAAGGGAEVSAHHGLDDGFLASYLAHYASRNPFVAGVARLAVGAHATAGDLVDPGAYRRGEFFNDWVRPQGAVEFVTTLLHRSGASLAGITVLRGDRAFTRPERACWASLAPHVRTSLAVGRRLRDAEAVRDGALAALDGLSAAAVVVDRDGRVVTASPAGERALRDGRGVTVRDGLLSGRSAAATESVRAAVAAVARPDARAPARPGRTLAMADAAGNRVSVLVSPLPDGRAAARGGPSALVLVAREPSRVAPGVLEAAFGLTRAEAALLSALAGGVTLADHARATGTRRDTVRSHLRQVLAKTGTRRQVDAVGAVLRDPVLSKGA